MGTPNSSIFIPAFILSWCVLTCSALVHGLWGIDSYTTPRGGGESKRAGLVFEGVKHVEGGSSVRGTH